MNTTTLEQIEAQAEKLAATATALTRTCREAGLSDFSLDWGCVPPGVPHEVDHLRRKTLASVTRLQAMLAGPPDFIQHIAHQVQISFSAISLSHLSWSANKDTVKIPERCPGLTEFVVPQTQILACLRWLGEFQVLACIPPSGEAMGTKDLADLVSVPEAQLRRVVRLMTTVGFLVLEEPPQQAIGTRQAQVAHTRLSASFVTQFSNLDAVMFLSETVVHAALHMPEATQRQLSGFSLVSTPVGLDFGTACKQQPWLRRQWDAYLGCLRDPNQVIADLLARLDWESLGRALVVEIDSFSTELAQSLAERHPSLRWIVQMSGPEAAKYERDTGIPVGSGSISLEKLTSPGKLGIEVQLRAPHTPQMIKDAAVYLVRSPSDLDSQALAAWVQAALQCHLAVLRADPDALLLLAVQLRPDPGSVDPAVVALACIRSMTIAQLTGGTAEMDLATLEQLIGRVRDSNNGGLVVSNKLHNSHCSTIALGIKYVSRPPPPEPLAVVDPSLGWGGISSP
ncbi:hypothetical protein KVR01_000637 [Diaporthe batatas]|uniref:uncharacterized protein n=1 Tax=Diaporthe batatas TaxID=748121 RepID=UPI001D051652|nr:uncharacterized protein KVR01_000637 [Diaporthe batatas]KAG8169892.1 hypothetical protein KVR01_000637 [Diaporthe batatas]